MRIHNNFIGGNISVIKESETDVYLENEIRDSGEDWFYWAFCAEDAAGKEITFHMQDDRLGYWGPAVSHDLKNWKWLNQADGNSFTYTFRKDENKVYFAHNRLYHPERFFGLCKELSLESFELCKNFICRSLCAALKIPRVGVVAASAP